MRRLGAVYTVERLWMSLSSRVEVRFSRGLMVKMQLRIEIN